MKQNKMEDVKMIIGIWWSDNNIELVKGGTWAYEKGCDDVEVWRGQGGK